MAGPLDLPVAQELPAIDPVVVAKRIAETEIVVSQDRPNVVGGSDERVRLLVVKVDEDDLIGMLHSHIHERHQEFLGGIARNNVQPDDLSAPRKGGFKELGVKWQP